MNTLRTIALTGLAAWLVIGAGPAKGAGAPLEAPSAAKTFADRPSLNEHVLVDGRQVTLGDLFHNAGPYAERVVIRAPQPGTRSVYDYRWLARVARAYQLDWRPMTKSDQVTVERAGIAIPLDEIEASILAALPGDQVAPDMEVQISNRSMRLFVPVDAPSTVRVDDVSYSPRSGRFTALVAAPADDQAANRTRITGQVNRMIEVPSLRRSLGRDAIIGEDDLEWIRVRADQVHASIETDMAQLIGQSPRRPLRAGSLVRKGDVEAPVLVPRGSQVTMILKMGNMTLTAKGKALEDGSDGETITVTNTQTHQNLDATVIGAGRVKVEPLGQQLASN